MEILINELSLTGQFGSIGDFIGRGLTPFLSVISEITPHSNILYKKRDFWESQLTATNTIHDVFVGKASRTNDEIRKSKSKLASLIDEPFWEDKQKHNVSDKYQFDGNNIGGYSLAESCERDKIVISFIHTRFSANVLSISKNGMKINVDNLFDSGHYLSIANIPFNLKNKTHFAKTAHIVQGQSVYQEISTRKYYWHLDNLHQDHYEVYNSRKEHIGIADMLGEIDYSRKVNGRRLNMT